MAASLETRIQTNRKTTKKQTEKQRNKQKQRYQKTRTCMAASLETPPAGALRAGDSPALGGSAADIIFTIYLLLLLQYSLFSSLFFFFYTWLPKVSFDYSDRFYCYHYFSSSIFTILTSSSGSLWSSSLWQFLATNLTSSTYQFSAI